MGRGLSIGCRGPYQSPDMIKTPFQALEVDENNIQMYPNFINNMLNFLTHKTPYLLFQVHSHDFLLIQSDRVKSG